jgi:tRNA-dihydrouridine synthase A
MVTTAALTHGDVPRHLDFDPAEHPVALQLGGSEPDELAACAKLGARWGYDEINLNCGCPSERVQRGAFGACLMAEPGLVSDCMKAMQDAVSIPVTVKHRLGIDRAEDYDLVRRFVEAIATRTRCRTFVVHARNAVLKGLSPRDNREIPRLRYDEVYRLKREFPELEFIANGGIATLAEVEAQLTHVDGVMLGRAAYHDSYCLATIHTRLFGGLAPTRAEVVERMHAYAAAQAAQGIPLRAIARHMLGLYHGQPGARRWRRMLSDAAALSRNDPDLFLAARSRVQGPVAAAA